MAFSVKGLATPQLEGFANRFLYFARLAGFSIEVTSVYRDPEHQRKLYLDSLKPGARYPAAPPGSSTHEKGLAFDIRADPRTLAILGRAWGKMGFTWGGLFRKPKPDPIHFDFRPR